MIYGSVCSGIEAATVAWHTLGWKAAWFSQYDPEHDYRRSPDFASRVLAHRYPGVKNLGDMLKLHETEEFNDRAIDLLVGGTPCQSFSIAGLRKGFADDRGNLTLEFVRLAQRKKPRWILWENVPGVLSIDGGRAFGSFIGGLAECGYGFAYRILDAQYFGVPQRRRRVFVVGHLGDWRPAAAVLFEHASLCRDLTPRREAGQAVAALTATGVGTCGADDNQGQAGHLIAMAHGQGGAEITTDGTGPTLTCNHEAPIVRIDGGQENAICYSAKLNHTESNGIDIDEETAYTLEAANTCGQAVAYGFKAGQGSKAGGIGYEEEKSPTLTASDSGTQKAPAVLTDTKVRRLTPCECERLQGFPDDYTAIPKASDGARYKALGNSMAVPVMRWLGQRIEMVNSLMKESDK